MNLYSMTNQQKRNARTPLRALVLLATASMSLSLAPACAARDLAPEFSTRTWVENDTEVAAVSMNGKDLLTFRSRAGSGSAAEEADDVAAELTDAVSDKNFDPDLLLPARDGDKAAIKLGNNTTCEFTPMNGKSKCDATQCLEASLKLVNHIRVALGATPLPSDFATNPSAIAAFSGRASWYGAQFHGRKTSDGSRFDMEKLTAAHRSLPFGTKLLVMNRKTGDRCVVEVNDRGPFIDGRVIDLSKAAARKLNMLGSGVAMVDCLVIGQDN